MKTAKVILIKIICLIEELQNYSIVAIDSSLQKPFAIYFVHIKYEEKKISPRINHIGFDLQKIVHTRNGRQHGVVQGQNNDIGMSK